MTMPNQQEDVPECIFCYDPKAQLLVIHRCGKQACLPCLTKMVRESTVPKPTQSHPDYEVGRLSQSISCPFCRGAYSRADLEALNVSADLLDVAFAVDRSQTYVRYPGHAWMSYSGQPLPGEQAPAQPVQAVDTVEVELVEALLDRLPDLVDTTIPTVINEDMRGFVEAAGRNLTEGVDAYRDLIEQLGELAQPSADDLARFVHAMDVVTGFVIGNAQRRAAVGTLVTAVDPQLRNAARHVDAMTDACRAVAFGVEDDVLPAWETLMQTPCAQIPVPELGSVRETLGDTTWFTTAGEIRVFNDFLAEMWEYLKRPVPADPVEERRRRARAMLEEIEDEKNGVTANLAKIDEVMWQLSLQRTENYYLRDQMNAARQVLDLDPL
ncbi:hypothetical protein [Lentzea sp. E54]|uniref:hypothetical protein n=1 Tax=Lentzea xerophila TaxID=3435883 RepID=UPI003DA5A7BA